MTTDADTKIFRLVELPGASQAPACVRISEIFFAASGTQTFASDAARDAFHERWLGRYLEADRQHVWIAADGGAVEAISGYLVGSFDDPARTARFSDIGYFSTFASLSADFPAHLHINLHARSRNRGTGARLVEAFVASAGDARLAGVHVVTGKAARNVAFYNRLGFLERGQTLWSGREIVFLGRALD